MKWLLMFMKLWLGPCWKNLTQASWTMPLVGCTRQHYWEKRRTYPKLFRSLLNAMASQKNGRQWRTLSYTKTHMMDCRCKRWLHWNVSTKEDIHETSCGKTESFKVRMMDSLYTRNSIIASIIWWGIRTSRGLWNGGGGFFAVI